MSGFDQRQLNRLRALVVRDVETGTIAGVSWLAARDGQVESGVAGNLGRASRDPSPATPSSEARR
jgi:hypothetical protein